MNVLGLIPARGGSKSIPHKNIAKCHGKTLLEITCDAARESRRLDRIVLSTDDQVIAEEGARYGIEVPFLRPPELASDTASSIAVVNHALGWLAANQQWNADCVILLQPTSPLRTARHICEALDLFQQKEVATVVSVVEVPHQFTPPMLQQMGPRGKLTPWEKDGNTVLRRQDKQTFFSRNGPAILIVSAAQCAQGRFYGDTTYGYIMDPISSIDIDSPDDLRMAEYFFSQKSTLV